MMLYLSNFIDENCTTGWEVKDRDGLDGPGFTMVSPYKEIRCDGFITEWRYQAKKSHPFRAIVWRSDPNSTTNFKIVGINNIPAGPINREVIFNVPEDQQFQVKAGDVIGWSFGNGVLAYSRGGNFSVRWLHNVPGSTLADDQIHDFEIVRHNGEREYSIVATIDGEIYAIKVIV